jgi:D-serine dehydratase
MKPIEFKEQTIVIAKDQPEYQPLPAHVFGDETGRVAFCWKLTWRERLYLLLSGELWQQVLTFDSPLQPQLLSVEKPEMEAAQ